MIDVRTRLSKNAIGTVMASSALTDNEPWHALEKGEFRVFNNGRPHSDFPEHLSYSFTGMLRVWP